MKKLVGLCIIILCAWGVFGMDNNGSSLVGQVFGMDEGSSLGDAYIQWRVKYGIRYPNNSEAVKRLLIFKENYDFIEKFNSENHSYRLGYNRYADLTDEEILALYGEGITDDFDSDSDSDSSEVRSNTVLFNLTDDIPDHIDWREQKAVTFVKDQKECVRAGWAFAAVAAVEGIWKIKHDILPVLSEQQLIDCDQKNRGCDGGSSDKAFRHIIESEGILNEYDYPYKGKPEAQTCESINENTPDFSITSYQYVQGNDEDQLLHAVARQPVAVSISTGWTFFARYTSGVYDGPCAIAIRHAVTIVGYGEENGLKYWLIKNSYGTDWGDKGYMKISRQAGDRAGHCNIAAKPVYPTIIVF